MTVTLQSVLHMRMRTDSVHSKEFQTILQGDS